MVHYSYFFTFIIVTFGINLVKCAEFVPVYIWGSSKTSEHVPALHKISEDSFKDTLLEYLKKDPYVIVFAEHTLSPEDFAQRDQNGEIAFPNIFGLKKTQTHVTYRPYVQNPIGAIKQLDRQVTELSIGSLLNSPNVPKNSILVIDLNDAKDDEQRFHMLKRHDSDVVSIYKDFLEQHDNVLAIYTAHHTSWVAPEEVTHKKSRSLLEEEEKPKNAISFVNDRVLMYLIDDGVYLVGNDSVAINNDTFTSEVSSGTNNTMEFTLKSTVDSSIVSSIEFAFAYDVEYYRRYWMVQEVHLIEKNNNTPHNFSVSDIYAPWGFSYHCGDLVIRTKDNRTLNFPGFQIQLYEKAGTAENRTFGDAYDCVGFTSVPIWSGLFVTFILLLIMTFGLTMMMDIKTMDRFDDAKGKTITINASE